MSLKSNLYPGVGGYNGSEQKLETSYFDMNTNKQSTINSYVADEAGSIYSIGMHAPVQILSPIKS